MTREAFLDFLTEWLEKQWDEEVGCDFDCEHCSNRADGVCVPGSFLELAPGIVQSVGGGETAIFYDAESYRINGLIFPPHPNAYVGFIFNSKLGQMWLESGAEEQLRDEAKKFLISRDGKEIGWFEPPAPIKL